MHPCTRKSDRDKKIDIFLSYSLLKEIRNLPLALSLSAAGNNKRAKKCEELCHAVNSKRLLGYYYFIIITTQSISYSSVWQFVAYVLLLIMYVFSPLILSHTCATLHICGNLLIRILNFFYSLKSWQKCYFIFHLCLVFVKGNLAESGLMYYGRSSWLVGSK